MALLPVAHLFEYLGDAVLPGDGEVCFAAGLAGGVENAEGAGISGGGDQDVLALAAAAKKSAIASWLGWRMPRPSMLDEAVGGKILEALANALECAGDAALDKAAGLGESDAEDPVHFALPFAQGVLGKQGAGLKAHLEVIHAEVGGVGVRHVDGDQRESRLS